MVRAPSVSIPHKVDRSKPSLSKALRTSQKILAPIVVSFIHCNDKSFLVSLNSLSTPFINIANCAASFTSVLSSIAKLHDTQFFTLSLRIHKYYQQVHQSVMLLFNAINLFSRNLLAFYDTFLLRHQ